MRFRKTKKYCYILGVDELTANNLIGDKALNLHKMISANVNVSDGFVLSGKAFDDFLLANDLVNLIVENLNRIAKADETEIQDYCNMIQEKILEGKIPDIIKSELVKSYEALSSFSDIAVVVRQSALNKTLDEYYFDKKSSGYINVVGKNMLLDSVKLVWADLFDESAVKYRLKKDYEGSLSQPVLVQKMVNAEMSGLLYNFDLNSQTTSQATIIANLGISVPDNLPVKGGLLDDKTIVEKDNDEKSKPKILIEKTVSDYVLVDKIKHKIITHIHNDQKFMLVRSQDQEKKDPFIKVKISKIWSEKLKPDELEIKKIMTALGFIENIWTDRIEIQWVIESGVVYFIDLRVIDDQEKNTLFYFDWEEKTVLEEPLSHLQKNLQKLDDGLDDKLNYSQKKQLKKDNIHELSKEKLLTFMKKDNEKDLRLSDKERDKKADSVQKMLPEIKTVTETWWGVNRNATEIKVFKDNLDGLGVFNFSEVIKLLGEKSDIEKINRSQKLQKKICDFLALFLKSVYPKPVLIELVPEIELSTQIEMFTLTRNLYGHRNFWCVIPEIKNLDEVARYKKELASAGFRRTNTFKIFQKISQPLFLSNIEKFLDFSIDGILLDVDKLLKTSLGNRNIDFEKDINKNESNFNLFKDFVINNLIHNSQIKIFTIVRIKEKAIFNYLLETLLDIGVSGLIYEEDDFYDFKQRLADLEAESLTKSLQKIKKDLTEL